MNVPDCVPDALEVVLKPEGGKARCPGAGKALAEPGRAKPDYLYLLPTEGGPAGPGPGICFENWTYDQAAGDAGCWGPVAAPLGAPPGPGGLPGSLGPSYVNSPGEPPAGGPTLSYVSRVASPLPPSGRKDSPPANPLQPAPPSEYRRQMAVPPGSCLSFPE